jgi:hypothetical protein
VSVVWNYCCEYLWKTWTAYGPVGQWRAAMTDIIAFMLGNFGLTFFVLGLLAAGERFSVAMAKSAEGC